MKLRHFLLLAAIIFSFLLPSLSPAQTLSAYIDYTRGVIIGSGTAQGTASEPAADLRLKAIDDAKKNIMIHLERQNLTEDETVGQHLSANPDKRVVFENFVDSASMINEKADKGKMTVTISLPISSEMGFTALKEWLAGERSSAPSYLFPHPPSSRPASAETIKEELRSITEPKRIALFTFKNKTDFTRFDVAEEFTSRLKERFKRDRRFIFLSPGESRKLAEKNDTSFEKLLDSDVTETIKLDGADGAVLGILEEYKHSVNKHGIGGAGYLEISFHIRLDLRILDAGTGRWLVYENVPVSLNERSFTLKSADDADKKVEIDNLDSEGGLAAKTFNAMLDKTETFIRAAFPLEGYVLKVMGDRVYINLTRADGVREGSILTIIRLGDILIDPVTGGEIDQIKDKMGTIKVVDVRDTYSQAVIEQVIQPVQEGDIVTFK
ncbi:MAG: FlgT C-terminal domain-containing protein [bacterium]